MSGSVRNKRTEELMSFALQLINGENGCKLIREHEDVLSSVTPFETMETLDGLLVSGVPLENVKANVGKILNAFYKSLVRHQWNKPGEGHFLHYLMQENREVEKILDEIKLINKRIFKGEIEERAALTSQLKILMSRLRDYELHYIKKENILFPHIEKAFPKYRCLQIMWSFHDEYRRAIKIINMNLNDKYPDYDLLNREIGKIFFVILPLVFREEQVIYPVAMEMLPESDWEDMMEQSSGQGWCYIEPPVRTSKKKDQGSAGMINLGSGFLTSEQAQLIFNNLPVDVTYIDENDEVKYFTESKERIFPRSRAIIGRKVQNCHPPQSVDVVNKIIDAFRKGEKDHADFWIQMKGRFIYIRYFALRNEHGVYHGTLEVSQDATGARELTNERRLLNWE